MDVQFNSLVWAWVLSLVYTKYGLDPSGALLSLLFQVTAPTRPPPSSSWEIGRGGGGGGGWTTWFVLINYFWLIFSFCHTGNCKVCRFVALQIKTSAFFTSVCLLDLMKDLSIRTAVLSHFSFLFKVCHIDCQDTAVDGFILWRNQECHCCHFPRGMYSTW